MITTLQLAGDERDLRIAESFASWLGRHSQRKSTRLARNAEELVKGTTLLEDLRNSRGFSSEEIALISCPTCIVVGERSDVRPETEILAGLIPGATKHVVSGCTHSVLWEQGAEVRQLITTWLSALMGRN
jgi:pimeloyl-ACP methyl ester carboxylesterase